MDNSTRTQIGEQADVRGVMLCACARHDRYCVRASDSEILVREEDYESLSRRFRVLNFPVYRGAVVFILYDDYRPQGRQFLGG